MNIVQLCTVKPELNKPSKILLFIEHYGQVGPRKDETSSKLFFLILYHCSICLLSLEVEIFRKISLAVLAKRLYYKIIRKSFL